MKKILYLDCFSGISGDMTLAALIDAGANLDYINRQLNLLLSSSVQLKIRSVNKMGISARQLEIELDQDMVPVNRNYLTIKKLITESKLMPNVKKNAAHIFQVIAAAEAKIHGVPIDQVHFHEIGAIDSIIDVIGVSLALECLEITQVFVTAIPLGSGSIDMEHGIYPNPAPATIEILKGRTVNFLDLQYEITTPTGAAIVTALTSSVANMPPLNVEMIGYGAGSIDLPDRPNVLRAYIGKGEQFFYRQPEFKFQKYNEQLNKNDIPVTKNNNS